MVKALITIFDDDTLQIFVKDKVLQPVKQEKLSYDPRYVDVDRYIFEFHFMHMNDIKNKFAFDYIEKGDSNNDDSN